MNCAGCGVSVSCTEREASSRCRSAMVSLLQGLRMCGAVERKARKRRDRVKRESEYFGAEVRSENLSDFPCSLSGSIVCRRVEERKELQGSELGLLFVDLGLGAAKGA